MTSNPPKKGERPRRRNNSIMRKEKYIKTQRVKGTTYFRVYFTYAKGKKAFSKSFCSNDYPSETQALNAACKARDLARAELITHGLPDNTPATIEYLFEEYEKLYVNRAGTHNLHKFYYDKYIAPEYGYMEATAITPKDIMANLNKNVYKCSDNELLKIRCVWAEIYKMARLDRVVLVNPMDEVIIPVSQKIPQKRQQYCSQEDVQKVLEYLSNDKLARNERELYDQMILVQLIKFIQATGCRPAEAFAISRKTSYDFDRKIIHIDKQYGTTKDGPGIVKPKARSIRDLPMTEEAENALRMAESYSDKEYIFQTYDGRFQNSCSIGTILKRAGKATGVNFHLYMLRHQMASYLIKETGDIRGTMEIMGHTGQTAAQSLDYARSTAEDKKHLLDLVENRLKS